MSEKQRVALVHEWLSSSSGSEKTFQQMAREFPDAELFALTHDLTNGPELDSAVRTTSMQRSSLLAKRRSLALPLMPLAWRTLRCDDYDVVITSSHAFSRFFPVRDAIHLSYVYTPLRYAWMPEVDGRGASSWMSGPRATLRWFDRRSVACVDSFAAISTEVQRRIARFYGRDSRVIFPPVDTSFFSAPAADLPIDIERDYVLGVSRWIPYKRLVLVIEAGERVGLPVVIAGDGPLAPALTAKAERASVPVRLVRRPSDEMLRSLYSKAAVVVFPPEEDFGIVPVEAQAAGTPVVALAAGGSLDTVLDGDTGALVAEQTAEAFADGIRRALGIGTVQASEHIARFSPGVFRSELRRWFHEVTDERRSNA